MPRRRELLREIELDELDQRRFARLLIEGREALAAGEPGIRK